MTDQPDASWGDALVIVFLLLIPVVVVAWVVGVSLSVRFGIALVIVAFCPVVFLILRARRRRAWAKRWQGPAHMYRRVPPGPLHVVNDRLIQDRGYLRGMLPGARYQFADDPSGFLLRDFVLVGTRAGIMEFLADHREQRIENRTSLPGAGIYMTAEPYQPIERYKVGNSNRGLMLQWLIQAFSLFVPMRHPVAELMSGVGDFKQAVDGLRDEDDRGRKHKPAPAPWTVFAVTFSLLECQGSHFIKKDSVGFGSIREILETII